mmetsp:Transcript_148093/g.258353  ORF Transcript_148093/g.258353 Transcript_148093/m.258353 type:complete len:385 (-) Transcript_148093:37-1191(-)
MAYLPEWGAEPPNQDGNGFLDAGLDAGNDAGYYEQLKNFVRGWGIDGPNTVDLMLCSREVQKHIMEQFRPSADTRNVNAVFCRFVKRLGSGETDSSNPLKAFAYRWGLDDGCIKVLSELPPNEQEEVMNMFAPGEDIRNKSAFFMRYIRSRHLPEQQVQSGSPDDPLTAFVTKWGLDDTAVRCLYELPLEMQEDIIFSFSPRSDARNISALFMSFVKTRSTVKGGGDGISAFIANFALDERAEKHLRDLTWDRQEEVMASFKPPPDTQNVSALFIKFAGTRKLRTASGPADQSAVAGSRWLPSGGGDPVDEFLLHWQLDDNASMMLKEMPDYFQQQIMASFNPTANTRNISALFHSFVKQQHKRKGQGMDEPPWKRGRLSPSGP